MKGVASNSGLVKLDLPVTRTSKQILKQGKLFLALIGLVLTLLVATWPLILEFSTALPLGTERELTVPLFNLWSLWWTADRAAHGFADYWQAPIFYPSQGAFSFSEPQPLTGLAVAGLWWFVDSPATVYNAALLLCIFLNGLFAYRVACALNVPFLPALLCGMFMLTLPFTAKLLGVLPLVPVFGVLWAWEGFVWFGKEGSIRSALWAGSGVAAQFFVSQQLMLLFAPFAILAGIVALYQQQFSAKTVLRLASLGAAVCLVLLLFAWYPLQLHTELGLHRSEKIVKTLSANPGDYFTKPQTALISFPPHEGANGDTGGLFPGACLLLLASIGTAFSLRGSQNKIWGTYLLVVLGVSVVFSLGMNVAVGGWSPFTVMRTFVPGFSELRSPFRFAVLVQMCLCLLSAFGLWAISPSRNTLRNTLLICAIGLTAIIENLSISQPLQPIPHIVTRPWTAWLENHQEHSVLAHIPFPSGRHVSDYEIETVRMLAQISHGKPIANGYSGFFPPGYTLFQLDMAQNFPDQNLFCFLIHQLEVDTLVVDHIWITQNKDPLAAFPDFLEALYRDDDVRIYELKDTTHTCQRV